MKQLRDFKIALKDMEPYVKDARFLTQGVRLKSFNMLVREAWGNWLLCVVLQKVTGESYTFGEQKEGDGIIVNKSDVTKSFIVEHVCAMNFPAGEQPPKGEDRIIWAINHKIKRGPEYAENKYLVVFFDGAGTFFRNKIRKNITGRHNFLGVCAIGLLTIDDNGYSYSVTNFSNSHTKSSRTFKVDINIDFTDWEINEI